MDTAAQPEQSPAPAEPRATWSSGVRVASVFGFEILVHWRVIVATAVAVFLATPLSPVDLPGALGVTPVEFVVFSVPMMVLSIFAHEFAHALAARVLGLGARSVFINLTAGHTVARLAARSPRDELIFSLSGPTVNLVAWGVLARLSGEGYYVTLESGSPVAVAAWFNFLLTANFLPILPMDGGRGYAAVMWALTGDRVKGKELAAATGPWLVAAPTLAIAAGIWALGDDPVVAFFIAGLTLFQIRGSLGLGGDVAAAVDRVQGLCVEDIMTPGLRATPDTLARTVVESRISRRYSPDVSKLRTLDLPYVVITDEGELVGLLPAGKVDRLAGEQRQWGTLTIADVMVPREKLVTVTPETEVFTALVYMVERELEVVLVVEDGEPVGCVTAARMSAALKDGPEALLAAEQQAPSQSERGAA